MDIHKLMQDIAVCEDNARRLREKLSGSTDFGLDCDTVDYRDKATVKSYLSQGKALLYPLKELGKALQFLSRHTEYAIYKIENKIQPLALNDGINSMPDEVLAMIFESAIDSNDVHDKWDARTLASVNHKFRTAALGSRKLWSTLSHEKGKKASKLFLKRSGNSPLTIKMGLNPPKWYMDGVLALGNRWGKVVIPQDESEFVSQVREYGKRTRINQTYPRLRALEVFSSNGLYRDDSDSPWHIPGIKSLICTNDISALSDESFASITTLDMTIDDSCTLETILPQLDVMQNLQSLSLTIRKADDGWGDRDYWDCDLKSLRELHITWSDCSPLTLESFLDKINMENVRGVELKFLGTYRDIIDSDIKHVFDPCDESGPFLRFPSLEDITILADPRKDMDDFSLEAGTFLRYPKIKNLRIKLPFIEPLDCHLMKDCQLDIRTIAIEGCRSGARYLLDCLLSHVNPDGSKLCEGLTKLRVWRCAEVTMNFLMDYLPEEKIDFLPYEAPYFFDGP